MRKIISLFTLFSVFLLVIGLSPGIKINASTTWNNDYVFDALSTTHNGISLTIDEGTNIFTLHGTTTATTDYNFADMFTMNSSGSILNISRTYYVYYEYISGTASATTGQLKAFEVTNVAQINRFIYLSPDNSSATMQNYQMNKGFVFTFTGTTPISHRMGTGSSTGTVFNQYKYRLTIKEVDPEVRTLDMFSTTTSFSSRGLTYSFPNANTLVMNGTAVSDVNLNLVSKINGFVTDPTKPALIYIKNTSGTSNDLSWGFSFNSTSATPGVPPQIAYSSTNPNNGMILDQMINFYLTPNQSGKVYDNLTFEFFVQEIELEISDTPEPPTPGETTTPPTGISLYGSFYDGLIYYNTPEELPAGQYYISTTTGSTFDFSILTEEQLIFTLNEGVTFKVNYGVDLYHEYTGPGDIVISEIGSSIKVRHMVSLQEVDSYTYDLTNPAEAISSLVVITATEPITEVEVSFFDDDGMTLLDSGTYEPGDLLIKPTDPVKEGFIFVGWETYENVLWNFELDTVGTETLDLWALYTEEDTQQFTVTFVSNGGTTYDPSLVYEYAPVMLPVPARTGYTFSGWYVDEALTLPFASNTPITEDITLYAKWTQTGGGTVTPPVEEASNTTMYIVIGGLVVLAGLGVLTSKKKKG